MVLVVPREIDGLKYIEDRIKDMDLNKLASETYKREIKLTLPKFKLEQTIDLKEVLEKVSLIGVAEKILHV